MVTPNIFKAIRSTLLGSVGSTLSISCSAWNLSLAGKVALYSVTQKYEKVSEIEPSLLHKIISLLNCVCLKLNAVSLGMLFIVSFLRLGFMTVEFCHGKVN